jgi:hypothetical protein
VGPRAGLDAVEKRKSLATAGNRIRPAWPVSLLCTSRVIVAHCRSISGGNKSRRFSEPKPVRSPERHV